MQAGWIRMGFLRRCNAGPLRPRLSGLTSGVHGLPSAAQSWRNQAR
jgi:hypothetical protein